MIIGLITIVALSLILCLVCRTSKLSIYLFKIVLALSCGLAILIIYFFTLGPSIYGFLNFQLSPWRTQVLPRFAVAVIFSVLVLFVSQFPFLFSKAFSKSLRNKIIEIETCIYVAFCLIGCVLCYHSTVNIPAELKPGNEVVTSIDSFEKQHGRLPKNLGELYLGMKPLTENKWEYKGQHFYYLNNEKAYSLVYSNNEYGDATYNSDVHEWTVEEPQYYINPVNTIPE